ncbi:hypothetical protein EDD15DRAFT_2202673 [Pisolithus albus]|nr:hypothetical protein EDD15DRAFT_2202673 [Pisolithus albus]
MPHVQHAPLENNRCREGILPTMCLDEFGLFALQLNRIVLEWAKRDLHMVDERIGHVCLIIRQSGHSVASVYAMQESWPCSSEDALPASSTSGFDICYHNTVPEFRGSKSEGPEGGYIGVGKGVESELGTGDLGYTCYLRGVVIQWGDTTHWPQLMCCALGQVWIQD